MGTFVTKTSKDYSILDNHTGEIIKLKQTKKLKLDDFIQVYLFSCPKIMELKGVYIKILICIWKYSSYNPSNELEGNIIHNNPVFKDYCAKEGLDCSKAVIDNAFSELRKQGLLVKRCRGEYMLNPLYFFRGQLSNRTKILYNIEVDPEEIKEM